MENFFQTQRESNLGGSVSVEHVFVMFADHCAAEYVCSGDFGEDARPSLSRHWPPFPLCGRHRARLQCPAANHRLCPGLQTPQTARGQTQDRVRPP